MSKLLTRDEFREQVFARDNHLCVLCAAEAQDAHHIIERRLWPDGGYYIDNGASVCGECHWLCESTVTSVERVRQEAGITNIVVPPSFYVDQKIDKWGNSILDNDTRTKGPLAEDPSVIKVMSRHPSIMWATKIKYPRTPHLLNSPGLDDDDFRWAFEADSVVVTEKMDGENTTMYRDAIHARSLDYSPHPSRDMMKSYWAQRCGDIPMGWRICGENLTAKHSVGYDDLPDIFLGFSVWNGLTCQDWETTLEWFELLGILPVPIFYEGEWIPSDIHDVWSGLRDENVSEGYVVRNAENFHASEFNSNVGKWVRSNHVTTDRHWRHKPVEYNGVRKNG